MRDPLPFAFSLFSTGLLLTSVALGAPTRMETTPARPNVTEALRADLTSRKENSFEPLLKKWELRYGTRAVEPLLSIASDRSVDDPQRYMALMGAAKLGGTGAGNLVVPYLRDKSWMIRMGSLRALQAIGDRKTGASALPLLHDPALVVRSEAVEAVLRLQPAGTVDALLSTLRDPANYRLGKAQWVPHKAIAALVLLKARDAASQLKPLLRHDRDPALQRAARNAIEKLSK